MKKDLDAILQSNDVDALLVTGAGDHNPAMVYLTGGGHLTNADLIQKRGEPPVLFHHAMERDEAARTGLTTRSFTTYPLRQLLDEAGGDRVKAAALRYRRMLADLGITSGRVAVLGQVELGSALPVFRELERLLPEITLVGDVEGKIMAAATLTKDDAEIERIRQMGKTTTEVVGRTAEFLTSRTVKEGVLQEDGKPLTLGRVKGLINLWLAELGAENPEGTIFAMGRDAGVPHSSGNPADLMRLGCPIVFDIFPCETGGGYFYDFTRTWCLGYAPEPVQQCYEHVLSVFQTLHAELRTGVHFGEYQARACELFEAQGHPTLRSQPDTEEGFVHGLGHGLGLRIHERPFSGAGTSPEDVLQPGMVMTVEPGLYYPEKGYGVRLEDTVAVRADGTFEVLAPYPLDLVLPMRG